MNHLRLFEDFDQKEVSLSDFYHIEKWIKSVWERLEKTKEESFESFFKEVEDCCGEEAVQIIDGMFDADHLHYYSNGTMGIDTGVFAENFEDIKSNVERILKNYID